MVVYCESGSLAAAAVRQLNLQGFTKAFYAARRLCRLARGEPAGHQGGRDESAGGGHVHHELVSLLRAMHAKLLAAKNVSIEEIDVESAAEKRAEMHTRSGRRTVPQIFIGDHHVGGSDDLLALEAAGKLDGLLGR